MTPAVRDQVFQFLRESLKLDVQSDTDDLIESGQLDSLALVELLFFLEQRFEVQLDVGSLDTAMFRTVESICGLVGSAGP